MDILQIFQKNISNEIIITDEALIAPHLVEWRDKYQGHTPLVLMPRNVEEVCQIVKIASGNNIKLTTQGGNTGLVGGQIPLGEVLISLKKMDKILEINPKDDCIICEAGTILQNIQEKANDLGRLFPLSLASQGSATIGGLISTNAGGVHVRRYGMMRNMVMGLEVVLPNGEIYHELKPLRKDNTGFDLKHYFIGSEGSLGIITKAALKLSAKPKTQIIAMVGINEIEKAIDCLHEIESQCDCLSAFEIMNENALKFGVKNLPNAKNPLKEFYPYLCLIEFTSSRNNIDDEIMEILENLLEKGLIKDCVISQSIAQIDEFWALREGMSAAQKPEGRAAKHDISVPISKIPQFLQNAQNAAFAILENVRIAAFGHISDGNIHYDVARPINMTDVDFQNFVPIINNKIHDIVENLGGSISAEHGIGRARASEFLKRKPKNHLEIMKTIKASFDPQNILNPKIYFEE